MNIKNRINFIVEGVKYIIKLYSAIIIFHFFYRGKTKQGLLTIGSSGGKYSDENAKELFEYFTNKEEEIIYIIDKSSPDSSKVQSIGKVLFRFSFKANLMILRSEVMIYDTSYLDIIRCNNKYLKHIKKINIFHGVLGLKKKSKEDIESRAINDDYIIATSEYEKRLKEYWKIPKDNIFVTGFPRYDNLFNKHREKKEKNIIFYMPTWRPWFKRGFMEPSEKELSIFKSSDYYYRITEIAESTELNNYLKQNDYKLEIYVHKLMHRYINKTKSVKKMSNIEMLPKNTQLQDKIIKSKILITDYSSILFDFLFLDKSVILYQFDRKKYYQLTAGSHIKKEEINTLMVSDYQELIGRIEEELKKENNKNDQADQLLDKYIKYKDNQNCFRLYTKIKELMD